MVFNQYMMAGSALGRNRTDRIFSSLNPQVAIAQQRDDCNAATFALMQDL
jgi:hypothetical protein